jgi:thioredoxin-related protein
MLVHRFALVSAVSVALGLSAMANLVRAEESLWQTDFAAAKTKAKAEKKLLLVDFTGSDWCGWCKKLVSEVFGKDQFKTEAPKKFVLVELDYPHAKKQSDELKKQNKELLAKYKVQGYPTILVMDADGKVIAQTGYQPGGPEAYLKHLGEFVGVWESIVTMKKDLDAAKGVDRAKLLDKIIDAYIKLNNEGEELAAWDKEIVTLDADGKAGLKSKHEFRILMAEFAALKEAHKLDEMKAIAEKALALSGVTGEQKQGVYMSLGECYFAQGDFANIVACLKKGIDAAPETDQAKQFKMLIERFKPMADAQAAVVKLKAELPNAKGLDRAKVLDQLVEAYSKLAPTGRGASPADIEKWSKEIMTLDADNKAGLKNKYEFRVALKEAGKLLQEGETEKGQAAIDKAIAMPGVSADQIQQAHFMVAINYLQKNDMKKGLECLKKALKAAPDGEMAANIKNLIGRVEEAVKADQK